MKSERRRVTLDIEKLYITYFMKVYSYVLNIVKNQSVAEEITQNTFVKVMTSQKEFQGESSEYTYLCAVAKNLSFDYFRNEQKKTELSDDEIMATNDNAIEEILTKETTLNIHIILHEMEEPYKEVFELRVFGELSFAEIAIIFKKTESWARVTYHRARLRMKERLEANE